MTRMTASASGVHSPQVTIFAMALVSASLIVRSGCIKGLRMASASAGPSVRFGSPRKRAFHRSAIGLSSFTSSS